jgi:hypothetical protein
MHAASRCAFCFSEGVGLVRLRGSLFDDTSSLSMMDRHTWATNGQRNAEIVSYYIEISVIRLLWQPWRYSRYLGVDLVSFAVMISP